MKKGEKDKDILPPPADFDKVNFTITIDACEGEIRFKLVTPHGKPAPGYHEIIGVLEYMKITILQTQMKQNELGAEKWMREQEEKKDKETT